MKTLNNLKIQYKCLECDLRTESFFCNFNQSNLQIFESLKITHSYPRGTTIFIEGQSSNGIYMLCQGRVKLSTCSRDGKVIILRIVEAGEVLGLTASVSDAVFEATAEVIEQCQVNFVRKEDFLRFLEQNAEASLSAVKQLSYKYHSAFLQICSLGLSNSVSDRLAKLFLGWCEADRDGHRSVQMKISYTHQEIAEMIGTSRETVTRILKNFKDRKLISLKGSELTIHDPKKLEAMIGLRTKF